MKYSTYCHKMIVIILPCMGFIHFNDITKNKEGAMEYCV